MAILYAYQQCSANLQTDDSRVKDLTRKAAHHLDVNLILSYRTCKRRESTCVGNRRIREKQMEVLEMSGRESKTSLSYGKIHELEMCVSDCIQKINVGSGFLFLVSRDDPVRTSKSTFCLIFFSSLGLLILIFTCFRAWNSRK